MDPLTTYRRRPSPEAQLAGLGLFDQPAEAPDLATLSPDERRAFERQRAIERLIPIARELAARAAPEPITVADVRIAGENAGILTGEEAGRALSFLPAVMKGAGLVATGRYRRSTIPRAHSNLNAEWVVGGGR